MGHDFPIRKNIFSAYLIQWLTLVSGKTSQDFIFANIQSYWSDVFRRRFEAGTPFSELDSFVGNPSAIFQEWIGQPELGRYWQKYNPSPGQYAHVQIPVLTITGIYDAGQLGAIKHYREHLANLNPAQQRQHFLLIGPWDHAGTRTPQPEFGGLKMGAASLIDLPGLHLEWYNFTMQDGLRPVLLRKNVTYYVLGEDAWHYADTLDEITASTMLLYLDSPIASPSDIFQSGSLVNEPQADSAPDRYVYDPLDTGIAEIESRSNRTSLVDQTLIIASAGKQLVYHSAPFERDTVIAGFLKFTAWISIDQPDTDLRVWVFEIGTDGSSQLVGIDSIRAKYRLSLEKAAPIETDEPLEYRFDNFMFTARRVLKGSRLRLVLGPINSIHTQKNFNSGREVSAETFADARPVTVTLYHDASHPSALYVPIGHQLPEISE
jgi:uncharacterized protein